MRKSTNNQTVQCMHVVAEQEADQLGQLEVLQQVVKVVLGGLHWRSTAEQLACRHGHRE
jgi:hypothetical protein